MRIIFFTPYYLPYISGITLYPARVFPFLPKRIKTTILTFKHHSDLVSSDTIDGVRVVRMPFLTRLSKGFISPQSLLFFWKELREHDMLLINLPSVEGLPAVLLAKCMRKKVIALFHCDITLNNNFVEKILTWLVRWVVIFQLRLSTRIITYTKDYVESLPYKKIFANKTVFCLPPIANETPDPTYSAHLTKLKKDAYWVGFVGRMAQEKGIEVAIEAMKKMPKNAVLVLVGPKGKQVAGEYAYYSSMLATLKKSYVKYELLPTLSGAKLASLYRSLDALVLPSINQTEAFGMVQAEAMLQGTPVVASNLPGVRTTINTIKAGKLVEKGDADALAHALREVMVHSWNREEIALKTKSVFSHAAVVRCMVQTIDTIAVS